MADETLVPWSKYAEDPAYAELPTQQKLDLFKEWHKATVDNVVQQGLVETKEDEDYLNQYLTQAYDSVLDTQSTTEVLGNAIQRSFLRAQQAGWVAGMATGALDPDNEASVKLSEVGKEIDKLPSSSLARKIGSDEVGLWTSLVQEPGKGSLALSEFLLENLPAQILTTGASVAVGSAIAGPVGAGVAGASSGGGSSLMMEYSGSVLEQLSKKGVDTEDPRQIAAAFNDQEFFKEINEKALKKGLPPAALDAAASTLATLSGVKAAKALKAARGTGFTPTVSLLAKQGAKDLGVQAGLGMGGEATGQLLSEGQITSTNQVYLEGLLEAPGNVASFAGGFGKEGFNELLYRVQSDPISNMRAKALAENLKQSGVVDQATTLTQVGAPQTAKAVVQVAAKSSLESEIDKAQTTPLEQPQPEVAVTPAPAEAVTQPEEKPQGKFEAQNTLEAAKVWGNIRARKPVSADEVERLGFMLPNSWKLNEQTGNFEFQGVPDETQKGEAAQTPAITPATEPVLQPQAPATETPAPAQAQQPAPAQQGQAAVAPALKKETEDKTGDLPAWEQVQKNKGQIRFLKAVYKTANARLPQDQRVEPKAGWKRGDYFKNLEGIYGKISGLEKAIDSVPGVPETIESVNDEQKRRGRKKADLKKKLYNVRDSKLTGEQQTWKEMAFSNMRRIANEVSQRYANIPNVDDYLFDDLLRKTANYLAKNPTITEDQLTDKAVRSILASWADDSAKDAGQSAEIQGLMKSSPILDQVETSDRPARTQSELDEEEKAAGETRQLRAQTQSKEAPGTKLLTESGYNPAREKLGPDQKLVLDWIINKLTGAATPSGIETKNLNSYEDLAKFLSTLNKKKTTAKAVSKMATEAREALASELQKAGVGVTADQISTALTPEGEQARARAKAKAEKDAAVAKEKQERQEVADRGRNATQNQYLAEKLVAAGMESTPESRQRLVSEVIEPLENGTLEDSQVEDRISNIQKGQPNEEIPTQPEPRQPVSGGRRRARVRQQPGANQPSGPGTAPARGTPVPVGVDQGQGQPEQVAGSGTRPGGRGTGVGQEQREAPADVPQGVDIDPALESNNLPRGTKQAVKELLDVLRQINFPGKVRLGEEEGRFNPVYTRKSDREGLTVYVSPQALAAQKREILKKFGSKPGEAARRWSQYRFMVVATHETVHNVHLSQLRKEASQLGLTFDQHLANEVKRVAKFLNRNRKLKKYVAFLYNQDRKFANNEQQYFEFIRMLVENETLGRTTESATVSAAEVAKFMDDEDRRWLVNFIESIIQGLSNVASRILGTSAKDSEYLSNTAKLLRQLNRDILNPPKKERVANNYVEPKQEFVAKESAADTKAAEEEVRQISALNNQSKKFLEEYAKELGIKVPTFKHVYTVFNEKTRKHEDKKTYRPVWKKEEYVEAIKEKLKEQGGKKAKKLKPSEDVLGAAVPSDRPTWLKPDGETIAVDEDVLVDMDGLGNHSKAALEYLEENEPDSKFLGEWKLLDPFQRSEQSQRVVEEMLQKGWVRVVGDGFNIYFEGSPNEDQFNKLYEAAIEDEARLIQDLTGITGKPKSRVVYEPPTSDVIGAAAVPRRGFILSRRREQNRGTVRLPDSIDDLALVKFMEGGSHPVALYESADGDRFIVKTGQTRQQFENEVAAENVYRVLGYPVADSKLIEVEGQPAKIAEYLTDGFSLREFRETFRDRPDLIQKVYDDLADGMLIDAYLFNYDSIGVNMQDNVLIRVAEVPSDDGETLETVPTVYRIDSGGTFDTKAFEDMPRNEPFFYDSLKVMQKNYPYLRLSASDLIAQISDLVLNSDEILNAVPQRLQTYMAQRLQYMADQLSAVDILTPVSGMSEPQTEAFFERMREQMAAVQVTRDDRGRLINAATGMPSMISGLGPNDAQVPKSEFRYRLERTPLFKAWFGDWENSPRASKVLDEAGEPRLMYHGTGKYLQRYSDLYLDEVTRALKTPSYIRRFGMNRFKGVWTSTKRSWAEKWANINNPEGEYHEQVVFPMYVKSTNPFDPRDTKSVERLLTFLKGQGQRIEPEDEYALLNGMFDWQFFEGVFDTKQNASANDEVVTMPDVDEMRATGVDEETIRKAFARSFPYRTLKAIVDLGYDGLWAQESLDKPELFRLARRMAEGVVNDPTNADYKMDFDQVVQEYNNSAVAWNFLAFRRDGVKSAMNTGMFSSIKDPAALKRTNEAAKLEKMVTVDGATGRNKLVYQGQTLYSTDSPAALAAYAVASPSSLARHNIARIALKNQPNSYIYQQRTAPSPTTTKKYPINDILGAAEVRPRRFGVKLTKVLSKKITDALRNKNYETLPDGLALDQAKAYFEKHGLEQSAADVLSDESPVRAGVQEILGMMVIDGYRKQIATDPEASVKLASFVDEFMTKSTETGRALRAYRFISMLGPEGLQALYYKKARKRDAVMRELFQNFVNQAAIKLEPLSQEALEKVIKEMEGVLKKANKLARTNTRRIAAKTTMTLWQQFSEQVGKNMTDRVNEKLAAMDQEDQQTEGDATAQEVAEAIRGAKPKTINQEAAATLRKIKAMIDNLAREQGTEVKEAEIVADPENFQASDEQIAALRALKRKEATIERFSDLLSLWPKAIQAWLQIKDTIREEIAVNPKLAPLFEDYLKTALDQPFTMPQIRNLMKASDIDLKELIRNHYRQGTLGQQSSDLAKLFMEEVNLGVLGTKTKQELAEAQGVSGKEAGVGVGASIAEKLQEELAKKIEATVKDEALKILTNLVKNQADKRLEPSLKRFLDRLVKLSSYGLLDSNNIQIWNQFAEQEGLTDPKLAEEVYNLAKQAEEKPEGYQRNQYYQKALRAIYEGTEMNKWDYVMTWWYMSILSGFDTQGANLVGNFSQSTIVMLPDLAYAMTQGKGGQERVSAVLRGMETGWNDLVNIFLTGSSFTKQTQLTLNSLQATDTGEMLYERGKGWKKGIGAASSFVRRVMSGVDSFFYNANKEYYLYKYAYDQAYNDGKSGLTKKEAAARALELVSRDTNSVKSAQIEAEREGFEQGSKQYQLRVMEILDQRLGSNTTESGEQRNVDTQALLNESIATALNNTYQQEPKGWLGSLTRVINILAAQRPETRFVIPFTRIVGNVWNMSLDMSGLGLVRYYGLPTEKLIGRRLGQWDEVTGSEREMLKIRALLGLTFVGLAAAMAALGYDKDYEKAWFRINGAGPENPQAKQALMKTGWKPWSLKIGGRYYSFLPTPLAIPLAVVGEIVDNYHYKKTGTRALFNVGHAALVRAALVPFDMMFLSGLSDFFKMTDSSQPEQAEARAKAFVSRLGSSLLIPNFIKDLDQKIIPYFLKKLGVDTDLDNKTAKEGLLNGIFIANTPILRSVIGKSDVDVLGNPIEVTSRITTARRPDPLVETLALKNAFPSPARKERLLGMIPMEDEEFFEYRVYRGKMLNQILNKPEMIERLRNSKSFVAQEIVKEASSIATEYAKGMVTKKLVESNDPRVQKLRKLGELIQKEE